MAMIINAVLRTFRPCRGSVYVDCVCTQLLEVQWSLSLGHLITFFIGNLVYECGCQACV